MLKILKARLQQYRNQKLLDVQAGFRKRRGSRDQIANICWIIEKAGEFKKKIYFCFIDYSNAFDCVDHSKLWNILKEMGIPDHLSCLLRQEEVKKQQLEPNMEQQTGSNLGKECFRAVYCLPAYFIYVQRTACAMPHRRRMAHSGRVCLLAQLWVGGSSQGNRQ